MSNNLNDIVDIQIQIASPATSLSGFESILIVGPEPTSKTLEDYKTLGVYTSLEGVKAAGWAEGDAVYDAAAVAFSQAVKPSQIYVAPTSSPTGAQNLLETPSTVRRQIRSGLLSARQELMRKSMRISPSGQRRMKRWPALLSPRPRAAWPLIPT